MIKNRFSIVFSALLLVLVGFIVFISIQFWLGSLILVPIFALILIKSNKKRLLVVILSIALFIGVNFNYLLHSFQFNPELLIAEEIPLVGLVFILHILHTYKYIPVKFKLYGIFLLFFGALKSKFMFLATPLLLVGLLDKQITTGLILKRELMGIKEIPVLYICAILLIGWVVMGVSAYPTQSDLMDMKTVISVAEKDGVKLYNDWGDGWIFVSLGYDTNYKMSIPNPDWNKLERPYMAWSTDELYNCTKLKKRFWVCN